MCVFTTLEYIVLGHTIHCAANGALFEMGYPTTIGAVLVVDYEKKAYRLLASWRCVIGEGAPVRHCQLR